MDKLTILQFQLALLGQIEDVKVKERLAMALYDELNEERTKEPTA